jgi:oligopeptide transport system substrate-binding protein
LDPVTGSRYASLLYDVEGAEAFHRGLVSDADSVGIRALDDLTLEVRLEGPAGHFLHLLSLEATPLPRHVVRAHGATWAEPENLVSSGPFLLESWHRGESLTLVRNPHYHGRFTGNVREVELSFFRLNDWTTQLDEYGNDRMDVVRLDMAPADEMNRARQAHAGEYALIPAGATLFLVFDATRPPFDDRRVRQALALSLDRNALVEKTLGDHYLPATGGFVPPSIPGHSPGIGLAHDPALAGQLLAKAGYSDGQDLPTLQLLTWRRCERHGAYLQAQWADALGVATQLEVMEWAEYLDRIHGDVPHMYLAAWIADYPDPDTFLRVAVRRHTGWRHDVYDQLIERARRVLDRRDRTELYRRVDRLLIQEAPIVPLCYEQGALLAKPWIRKLPFTLSLSVSLKDAVIDPH